MSLNLIKMPECISVKAGHLAIHKYFDKRKKDKKNKTHVWSIFSILKNVNVVLIVMAVTKEGAKKKTYTETIICDSHSEQVKFQETEHFKEKCGNAIK